MDFLKQKGPLAREFCNTLIYIISLVSLKPSSLQRVLTELQWNGMWFFSLAFFAVIFMEMLSDFLQFPNTFKSNEIHTMFVGAEDSLNFNSDFLNY